MTVSYSEYNKSAPLTRILLDSSVWMALEELACVHRGNAFTVAASRIGFLTGTISEDETTEGAQVAHITALKIVKRDIEALLENQLAFQDEKIPEEALLIFSTTEAKPRPLPLPIICITSKGPACSSLSGHSIPVEIIPQPYTTPSALLSLHQATQLELQEASMLRLCSPVILTKLPCFLNNLTLTHQIGMDLRLRAEEARLYHMTSLLVWAVEKRLSHLRQAWNARFVSQTPQISFDSLLPLFLKQELSQSRPNHNTHSLSATMIYSFTEFPFQMLNELPRRPRRDSATLIKQSSTTSESSTTLSNDTSLSPK